LIGQLGCPIARLFVDVCGLAACHTQPVSVPPRRRVDLTHLPAWIRYAIALIVLAAVIAIVLVVRGSGRHVAGWYSVVVRVGAVGLLIYLVAWAAWRITRRWRHGQPR
jgi:peptidoglycan/LPS O-acetylase OafA/YrhL